MIAAELRVPTEQQILFHNGRRLQAGGIPLFAQEVLAGDVIVCKRRKISMEDIPNNLSPEALIELVHQNPHLLDDFDRVSPDMGRALRARDVSALRMQLMMHQMARHKQVFEKNQEMARIAANPDSAEAQALIEERIRQENVNANYATAYEEMPEAFARVTMLYIDVELNGHPLKAFVDSGAEMTVMSVRMAEQCGLMRLVDRRMSGTARGVGTAKIVGRIHIAQIKIGPIFVPISITVLETEGVDFLFGLDMLKRHRCLLDLDRGVLVVGGSTALATVPFLSEAELPPSARGTLPEER